MGIPTDQIPAITGFGSQNDFLANGPSGTGRLTGAAAAKFFDGYFPYALYNYDGQNIKEKFAGEMDITDPATWIKQRLANHDVSGLHPKDFWVAECDNGYILKPQIGSINPYLRFGDTELTKWHIDFICKDLWPDRHVWNKVNYNNGIASQQMPYLASDLKAWLNSEAANVPNAASADPATVAVDYTAGGVYFFLPTALKNVIVNKRMLLSKRYTAGSLLTDDNGWDWGDLGKVWVPSEMEVYGTIVWGTKGYSQAAFTQYDIFKDSKMRIKGQGNGGARAIWWLLTPASGNSTHAAYVNASGNANNNYASHTGFGAPVCFRISE